MGKPEKDAHLNEGDIIGIDCGYYQQLAIYAGKKQVIWYCVNPEPERLRRGVIITELELFLGEEDQFYSCDFTKLEKLAKQSVENRNDVSIDHLLQPIISFTMQHNNSEISYVLQDKECYFYTAEETLERALEKVEEVYLGNSVLEELGHAVQFPIWCKMGIKTPWKIAIIMKTLRAEWKL